MDMEAILPLIISFVAMIISVIALVYTAKTYLLKSGASLRASCSWTSSISCEDKYVSSLLIENLKDRAVVIFKAYVKLGQNYYIEIDNFEKEPLIIRPFEIFKKDYDPIDFYSVNLNRIKINKLLDDRRVKNQIVLSTSDGKYTISSHPKYWDPVIDFFNNHMTAVVHPMRSTYKGKSYGINAKYIVEFKMKNGKEEVVPIYPEDYQIKKFRKFRLTGESLKSKDSLEEFLYDQVSADALSCEDVVVHDIKEWRDEIYEMDNKETITAEYYNWFMYNVVGRLLTKISDYKLKRKNRQRRKQQESR